MMTHLTEQQQRTTMKLTDLNSVNNAGPPTLEGVRRWQRTRLLRGSFTQGLARRKVLHRP